MDGGCLDPRIREDSSIEQFGAAAYRWLLDADVQINRLRNRLGRDYAPIASRVKARLAAANRYIRRFERTAACYAAERGADGIVCGHIHKPALREINGVVYANDGDWVEHRTAIAEDHSGQLQLLQWQSAEPHTLEDDNETLAA
jgi:UDP-2,3-diacylglucosamine pyrophosphatase LpxH